MAGNDSGADRLFKVVALNCRYPYSFLALFHVRQELFRYLHESRVETCQLTINDPYYQRGAGDGGGDAQRKTVGM